jgi:2'-5' RNA ligase
MAGIRSFVAIELPDEVKTALSDLQGSLKGQVPPKSVRWVRSESIHLTLQFLGDVAPGQVEAIANALRKICANQQPFMCQLRELGVFPNPRRPRIVWVGVAEPSGVLKGLQKKVALALEPLGFESEKRPFTPHLTIGRVDRRASQPELIQLGKLITYSSVGTIAQVPIHYVTLMKSDLRPTGALYTPLATLTFGKSAN